MSEPTGYDVRAGFFLYPHAFTEAYAAWLVAHGIAKEDTYRTEHHVIDAPLVRVFQYDRDTEGRRIWIDETSGEVAKRKPFDVLIKTPPPKPEDYA